MNWVKRLLIEEDGPTAVEYAVMLALLIMVCITAIGSIGTNTINMMDPGGRLSGALSGAS